MSHGGKRQGAGRKQGVPNGNTHDLRSMILGALDKVGGLDYLAARAGDNPTAFMSLIGRVLPLAHAGADGTGPLVIRWKTDETRPESAPHSSKANGKDHAGAEHGLPPVDRRN